MSLAGVSMGDARCQSDAIRENTELSTDNTPVAAAREELRRVALAYLVEIMQKTKAGNPMEDLPVSEAAGLDFVASIRERVKPDDLPEDVFDVDKVLSMTPLMRENNAFHDTLNSDSTILCPYVLYRRGNDAVGMDAVVRFGDAVAGHPKIVHGGITALTFDNLLGWALFMHGTGAVFTASLKVDYKAPLPCLTTAHVDVTIDRVEGRKLFVTGRLRSLDGEVLYATVEALFIKPRPKPKPDSGE